MENVGRIHGRFWDDMWLNMKYWERQGYGVIESLSRAYYWDFVEIWDSFKLWDEDRKNFCRLFKNLFPNMPKPHED